MSPGQMRRVIGLLVDKLHDAAFTGAEIDAFEAQVMLQDAGLTFIRPATEADVEEDEWGELEVGDDFHALTDFALQCMKEAGT